MGTSGSLRSCKPEAPITWAYMTDVAFDASHIVPMFTSALNLPYIKPKHLLKEPLKAPYLGPIGNPKAQKTRNVAHTI